MSAENSKATSPQPSPPKAERESDRESSVEGAFRRMQEAFNGPAGLSAAEMQERCKEAVKAVNSETKGGTLSETVPTHKKCGYLVASEDGLRQEECGMVASHETRRGMGLCERHAEAVQAYRQGGKQKYFLQRIEPTEPNRTN